jgi:hypothetical protein
MNVTSELKTVTVYREGAVCTRRAKLEGVDAEVRVVGLPMGLVPGSVRGRVLTGPVGLRVMDVRPGFDAQFGDAIDESAEVKARDAAKVAVARLEARFNRLDAELRELQALKPQPFEPKEGDAPRPAPVEATLALTAFVDQQMAQLLTAKQDAERELKDAREELQLRERRLQEASAEKRTQKAKVTRAIVLSLSQAASGPVELEVEYQVPGVRWVPNYTLRLEKGFQGGALRLRASVAQDTGEDWKGVALSLSTATLLRRTDVPELKSLRIGRSQPQPPKAGFREPPSGLDELFASYDGALRPPPRGGPMPAKPVAVASFAPPPPPPAPSVRREMVADEPMAELDAMDELSAPPPQSRQRTATMEKSKKMAPRAPGNAPMAPPPMQAMPMPSRSAAPMAKGGGVLGGLARAATGAVAAVAAPMMDVGGGGGDDAFFDEQAEGGEFGAATVSYTPAEGLLDYDRLRMPGADVPGARGKLSKAPDFESVFAVGVSVQIDVLLMVLNHWQSRANKIGRAHV